MFDGYVTSKTVRISLDTKLLERIDAQPETKEHGRSAFFRVAVEDFLARKRRREIDRQLVAAYRGRGKAILADIEDLAERQSWPDE